jgi:hypothetical protein|tara:strand:+ start:906 stop:1142 length:237 start_codon:yes stop_codon:yes gene_type:complete
MITEIKYGNTIHTDNTVAKYTTYIFKDMATLMTFWKENGSKGKFKADLKELSVTSQEYISSEEYFIENGLQFSMEEDF